MDSPSHVLAHFQKAYSYSHDLESWIFFWEPLVSVANGSWEWFQQCIYFIYFLNEQNKSPCDKINTHLLQGSEVCERKMEESTSQTCLYNVFYYFMQLLLRSHVPWWWVECEYLDRLERHMLLNTLCMECFLSRLLHKPRYRLPLFPRGQQWQVVQWNSSRGLTLWQCRYHFLLWLTHFALVS